MRLTLPTTKSAGMWASALKRCRGPRGSGLFAHAPLRHATAEQTYQSRG
jgi:hypothetical protein